LKNLADLLKGHLEGLITIICCFHTTEFQNATFAKQTSPNHIENRWLLLQYTITGTTNFVTVTTLAKKPQTSGCY
jgi:hypothetical protein